MAWLSPPLLWFEIVVFALVGWCIYRFSKRPGSRIAALRVWLAYVAIGIALVVAILIWANYGPNHETRALAQWKWVGFVVNTLFVFGYTMRVARPLWRKPKLWGVISGLLILHGIGGWSLLSRFERIPLLWYVPIDLGEIWAALTVIQLVLPFSPPPAPTRDWR